MSSGEKQVFLLRHGRSNQNGPEIHQSKDSVLDEAGRRQGEILAKRTSKLGLQVLLSSKLPRARQTAEYISRETGLSPVYSDLLAERRMPSSVQGMPKSNEQATQIWTEWFETTVTPGSTRVEDGENYEDLVNRANKILDLFAGREEGVIGAVTHGVITRVIAHQVLTGGRAEAGSLRQFLAASETSNTGITEIHFRPTVEPAWMLLGFNDHSHLE